MKELLTWEKIGPFEKRAKVIGGWLVIHGGSLTFVPDEGHYWKSDWSKE